MGMMGQHPTTRHDMTRHLMTRNLVTRHDMTCLRRRGRPAQSGRPSGTEPSSISSWALLHLSAVSQYVTYVCTRTYVPHSKGESWTAGTVLGRRRAMLAAASAAAAAAKNANGLYPGSRLAAAYSTYMGGSSEIVLCCHGLQRRAFMHQAFVIKRPAGEGFHDSTRIS